MTLYGVVLLAGVMLAFLHAPLTHSQFSEFAYVTLLLPPTVQQYTINNSTVDQSLLSLAISSPPFSLRKKENASLIFSSVVGHTYKSCAGVLLPLY